MAVVPSLACPMIDLPGPVFVAESLERISEDSDVIQYVMWAPYEPSWEDEVTLFDEFVSESALLTVVPKLFPDSRSEASAAVVGVLKYAFAFERMLAANIGVDDCNLNGLPYFDMAARDLESSRELIRIAYYGQAEKLMRTGLEAAIVHAYFSVAGVSYWELPWHKTPAVRVKRTGMLDRLCACRRIGRAEASEIADLYEQLSFFIHSRFKYESPYEEFYSSQQQFLRSLTYLRSVSHSCTFLLESLHSVGLYTADPLY